MYEFYARDTSHKIRSVFKAKGMSGKHLTGFVAYGYLWAARPGAGQRKSNSPLSSGGAIGICYLAFSPPPKKVLRVHCAVQAEKV